MNFWGPEEYSVPIYSLTRIEQFQIILSTQCLYFYKSAHKTPRGPDRVRARSRPRFRKTRSPGPTTRTGSTQNILPPSTPPLSSANGLLPSESDLQQHPDPHFVLWQPKRQRTMPSAAPIETSSQFHGNRVHGRAAPSTRLSLGHCRATGKGVGATFELRPYTCLAC